MTRRAWSLAPLIALALVGCRRGERPRAATGRADSATGAKPDFSNPASAAMRQRAPGTFRARFETRKGSFVIAVQRDWAPLGADRFSVRAPEREQVIVGFDAARQTAHALAQQLE